MNRFLIFFIAVYLGAIALCLWLPRAETPEELYIMESNLQEAMRNART